jgi:hypothetical protein
MGMRVNFTLVDSSGGTVATTSALTDETGVANAPLTLPAMGQYTLRASYAGVGYLVGSETERTYTVTGVRINTGWNLIDVPTTGSGIGNANALATSLNSSLGSSSVSAVATYHSGRFTLYVPGYSAPQTLNSTDGIFALSVRAGLWQPAGSFYTTGQTVHLNTGWNLVAAVWPLGGMTASRIATEISFGFDGIAQEIATYGPSGYQTWTPSSSSSLRVPISSGLWILMDGPDNWTPS